MAHIWAEVAQDGAIGYTTRAAEGAPGPPGLAQLFGAGGVPLTRDPQAGQPIGMSFRVGLDGVERDHTAESLLQDTEDLELLIRLQQRKDAILSLGDDLESGTSKLVTVNAEIDAVKTRRAGR